MARPDLAMRCNHPNENTPVSNNPVPAVPFYPPAAPSNGPGVASPAGRPLSYQNQQVAGQNQPVSPPRLREDFDPMRANPPAAGLGGNAAPEQLPAQFPGYNMADDGDEPMMDFDFDLGAFDQTLAALGVNIGAIDDGRVPPSPFPLRGPRLLPADDNGLFGPRGSNARDAGYTDLLPMIPARDVAVAEIPSGAVGVPSQPMAGFCMEEQCARVATGECADWRHVRGVDGQVAPGSSFTCDEHNDDAIAQIMGSRMGGFEAWNPADIMNMRAYACNFCAINVKSRRLLGGTGAKVFGAAAAENEGDDVAVTVLDRTTIGGLQGKNGLAQRETRREPWLTEPS